MGERGAEAVQAMPVSGGGGTGSTSGGSGANSPAPLGGWTPGVNPNAQPVQEPGTALPRTPGENAASCATWHTEVDTPSGVVPIETLRVGDAIWAAEPDGRRISAVVVAVRVTPVGAGYRVIELALADGRNVSASAWHPLADGRYMGELAVGDTVDGSVVVRADVVDYFGPTTHDVRTSGSAGAYFAGGIPFGSTLSLVQAETPANGGKPQSFEVLALSALRNRASGRVGARPTLPPEHEMQIAAPVLAPLRLRTLRERNARADLAERLGQPPTVPGAVGVELEFVVVAGDEPVDFRRVLPSLDLGRPRLDPDDAFARRLPTGSVITCDGREAEVSVAPVEIRRGFASAVTRDAQAAADALDAALPVGLSLRGYSTHISIEVPNDRVVEVGRTFVTRFGPRLRALMDGPEEPGLRVRPRFHRLELCGDFASGARLEAAVIHAAGGVAACLLAGSGDPFATPLPEEVRASVRPAIERPGWFIDKAAVASAWGADTYELARGGYARVADHDESSAAVVTAGIRHLLETSRSGVGDPGARVG